MVNDHGQVVGVVTNGSPETDIAHVVVSGVDVKLLREYIQHIADLSKMDTADKCNDMGLRHSIEGRQQVAIELFTKAIQKDSRRPEYFENRAVAFFYLDDQATAMTNIEQAIKLNSTRALAFQIRAAIHSFHQPAPAGTERLDQSDFD